MGIISRIKRGIRAATLREPTEQLLDAFGVRRTTSGVTVNEETALTFAAFWAAVSVISKTIASLPLHVYRAMPNGGKEKVSGHPHYKLLHNSWNKYATAMVSREAMCGHCLTYGNGYAFIEFGRDGYAKSLQPITPDRVEPKITPDGDLIYVVHNRTKEDTYLASWEVLHVPGLGFDGIVGYSIAQKFRELLGVGLAAEKETGAYFGNGSRPDGVLETDHQLDDKAFDRLRKQWASAHSGPENSHKTALLEAGVKWHSVSLGQKDAQVLETRKFSVTEVARVFGIPPHMIGDLEHATFTNIEHQGIEFVTHCIRPWLVRFEQEYNRKLFPTGPLFCEHVVDGLLRGDTASRYSAYATAFQNAWLNPNEIRSLENLNPYEGGDTYYIQSATVPIVSNGVAPGGDVVAGQRANILSLCGRIRRREVKSCTLDAGFVSETLAPAVTALATATGNKPAAMLAPEIAARFASGHAQDEDENAMADRLIGMVVGRSDDRGPAGTSGMVASGNPQDAADSQTGASA